MTEAVAPRGGGSSDAIQRLAVYGIGVTGDLTNVRPFRISTMQEILLMRMLMERVGSLHPGQFAENPWGFPFIPLPEDRSPSAARLVLAPESVKMELVGHPIYWIDPSLTAPTGEESDSPARWGVRMFYLIMALGLWDPDTLTWYNAPESKGVRYTRVDFANYQKAISSALDSVRYTSADLRVPYEEVVESTRIALGRLGDLQQREWLRYRTEQVVTYRDALQMLDENGTWSEIESRVAELSAQMGERAHKELPISEFVSPIYECKSNLVDLLNAMERTIVILSTPVLREQSVDTIAYSRAVTLLKTYNERIVDGGYERELDAIVGEMFEADGTADPRSFALLHERASALHMDAWRRLKVAAVNFVRQEQGETPFGSHTELQVFEALDDVDGLPSAQEMEGLLTGTRYTDISTELSSLLDGTDQDDE